MEKKMNGVSYTPLATVAELIEVRMGRMTKRRREDEKLEII